MAQSHSKTMIIGNMGADPDVRFTSGGNPIAKFSVATSETWKDKTTGQPFERTEWHRVVVFGALAEIVRKFGSKGSKVYVEGRNQTRDWVTDGIKRYVTEIVVDQRGSIKFLDPKPVASPQNTNTPDSQFTEQHDPASDAMPDYPPFSGIDDIPFAAAHGLSAI